MKLGRKITIFSILLVMAVLLIQSMITVYSMRSMKNHISEDLDSVRDDTEINASGSVMEQYMQLLSESNTRKAEEVDDMLNQISEAMDVVADCTAEVYRQPEANERAETAPRTIHTRDGDWSMYFRLVPGLDSGSEEVLYHQALLENMGNVIAQVCATGESINSVCIAMTGGVMMQLDPADSDHQGSTSVLDFQNREWYRQPLLTGERYLSAPTMDVEDGILRMYCSVPVTLNDEIIGVVAAEIDEEVLTETLDEILNNDTTQEVIYNQTGELVYDNTRVLAENGIEYDTMEKLRQYYIDNGGVSADESLPNLFSLPQSGKSEEDGDSTESNMLYAIKMELPDSGWTMISLLDNVALSEPLQNLYDLMDESFQGTKEDMTSQIWKALRQTLVWAAIIIGVALILAACIGHNISAPIRLLTEKVRKVNGENLDFTWEDRSTEETNVLADAFDEMTGTIKTYMQHVERAAAEQERNNSEMRIATTVQLGVLPKLTDDLRSTDLFELFADTLPAREVGGDFYDFFFMDRDHLALVMADVSGKGVPAALFMVESKQRIRSALFRTGSPAAALAKVNNELCENNAADMFVTAWAGIVNIHTGLVTACNAGHEYPAVSGVDGIFSLMKDKHGFVLGEFRDIPYRDYEFSIEPGGALFLYTDGVPEASDADQELFTTARMLEALNSEPMPDAERKLQLVNEAIRTFVRNAPQFDDITMLMWRRKPTEEDKRMRKITVDADSSQLSAITDFLEEVLTEADAPETVKMKMSVVLEELFTNIAYYAYPDSEVPGKAEISAGVSGDPAVLTMIFSDTGRPYNPLEKKDPDVTLSAGDRPIGGLGIFMVKKMVDEITYEYRFGHNVLTVRKNLS